MAITRLSGGTTPANGSDPRTFPTIWNAAADDIEAAESAISTLQSDLTNLEIDDLGDVTITTPADGEVLTYDDGTSEWVNQALPASGKILQVVQAVKTDVFTTTSTSFVTIDDLSASITPSSTTSKILVMCQISASGADNAGVGHFKVVRGATDIYIGDASSNRIRAVVGGFDSGAVSGVELGRHQFSNMITFLDSPATTSSTTYNAQTRQASTGTVFVNRGFRSPDDASSTVGASSITLMEVAG